MKQSEVIALIKEAHESITRFKREYSPNVHEIQNYIDMKVIETKCKEVEITDSKGNSLKSAVIYENEDHETTTTINLEGKGSFSLNLTKQKIRDLKDLLTEFCNQI